MLDVKFHSDRYRQFKYDFKDFIVNEKKLNYPMKRENIGLSVLKRYSLFYNY